MPKQAETVGKTQDLSEYSARHLQVLEGLEAVRKRPGMYIGSTDQRGLMHCVWEIVDNAIDEALEGFCQNIRVTLCNDQSVLVEDDGRGIPVDEVPGLGLSGVEVVFTKLHAGGKFGGGMYSSTGGLHGVGASVVNALSARLDVEVDRNGKTYQMQFRRGVPGEYDDSQGRTPNAPFTPFTSAHSIKAVNKAKKNVTGTRIRFWHDFQIFPETEGFSWELLVERLRQSAFLVPGLHITVSDQRNPDPEQQREETFHFAGGVVDYADFLAPDRAITDTWQIEGGGEYEEIVQQLNDEGHLEPVTVTRTCKVECALRWGVGYESQIRSFVNVIATPKGGTHQTGFEQGLLKAIRQQVEKRARTLKVNAKDGKIEKEDVLAGLTAVVTVSIAEPQFEGQTKEILGTPAARGIVNQVVSDFMQKKLTSSAKTDKQQAIVLLEKVVGEMKARQSARIQKEISRRKTALETSSLPAKLADCRSNDVASSELFIVEGNSALGTAKAARSSKFQALFPIRGKILNVQKASFSDMLSNQECSSLIQVIGAGSGRSFDLEQARYGKIILMTDADVDGAHIRTLLLTLFFRYMRPLVEAGRVYAAVPPLHRIEIPGRGRQKSEIIYTYSDAQLHETLERLRRENRKYKEPIQRYKGLGEMDADQLAETTMNPESRTLRRVTLADETALQEAEDVFELLMGQIVAPRREFIVEGARDINRERIDA